MKKLILLSLACVFISTSIFSQTYSGGSGVLTDPYLISSKADMEALATAVNGGKKYEGIYFKLTQNITGVTTIIGNSSRPFCGHFRGEGYEINVNIKSSATRIGIFANLDRATIKNLGVTGSIISTGTATAYIGAICGFVTIPSSSSGMALATTISNCYNAATIEGGVYAYCGGICGRAATNSSGNGATISNCYNTGNVTGARVCGIGGTNISDCYNTGKISGQNAGGGIAMSGETITKCFNTGEISGQNAGAISIAFCLHALI